MLNFSIKKITMLFCAMTLLGCASQPREVSASMPLVMPSVQKPDKQQVPEQYWLPLSDPRQHQLQHEKYNIQLSAPYTSALGQLCRALTMTDNEQKMQKRIVCEIPFVNVNNESTKAWFLEKEIIESSHYVEL